MAIVYPAELPNQLWRV